MEAAQEKGRLQDEVERKVTTVIAGTLLLIFFISIMRIFRWAVKSVPMHDHSWEKWMTNSCLCQRCSHIRALEHDLCIDGLTLDQYDKLKAQPTHFLTVNEERGMLYSDLRDLKGNILIRTLIGPAKTKYYTDTHIEKSMK